MKKTFLLSCFTAGLLIASLTTSMPAQAKEKHKDNGGKQAAFVKGSKTLGFALGFGVDYDYYGSVTSLPAFNFIYDQGIINDVGPGTIGVGGMVAYKTAYYKYPDGYKATWDNYVIAARGTYHLTLLKNKNNKFDPYGGVVIGLRIDSYHDTYYNVAGHGPDPYNYSNVSPVAGLFVGAKYNFSTHFGVFSELGYDVSLFRIGINANF